jgi:hypothetical protein
MAINTITAPRTTSSDVRRPAVLALEAVDAALAAAGADRTGIGDSIHPMPLDRQQSIRDRSVRRRERSYWRSAVARVSRTRIG